MACAVRLSVLPAPAVVRGGLAVFAGLVAVEHLLRPDLSPVERFVSEYGRGWTAPLQVAAFVGWLAASAACATLAARARRRPVARRVTAGALAVATAGVALAAAFTTQTVGGELPPGIERSAEGRLHDLGTLLILAGLLTAALASLRLVPRRGYRLTVLALAVALFGIVPALTLAGWDAPGIGQRGLILVGCAWQLAFARAAAAADLARTQDRGRPGPAPARHEGAGA